MTDRVNDVPLVEFDSPEPKFYKVHAPFLTDPAGHYLRQVESGEQEPDPSIDQLLEIRWIDQPDGTRKRFNQPCHNRPIRYGG